MKSALRNRVRLDQRARYIRFPVHKFCTAFDVYDNKSKLNGRICEFFIFLSAPETI